MNYYAGMDIGGTNGRLKLKDGGGNILGEFTGPGCSMNTDGYDKSRTRASGTEGTRTESIGLYGYLRGGKRN